MMAILRCFWTDRAIWVKSIATLELLEPLETLAERAARSAASTVKSDFWFNMFLSSQLIQSYIGGSYHIVGHTPRFTAMTL